MQILFINNKPVILGATSEKESLFGEVTSKYSSLPLLQEPELQAIPALLQTLTEESMHGQIILSNHPEQVLSTIINQFSHWQAAGGLVTNPKGEILMLFRRGKWDLPKGKIESEESPEETALREVTEETGLQNIKITKKLTETWHSYPLSVYKDRPKEENAKDVLKHTFWYQMDFTGEELTVPQIEEDIVDIQWIKPENIEKYVKFSYPNLKLVFEAAGY